MSRTSVYVLLTLATIAASLLCGAGALALARLRLRTICGLIASSSFCFVLAWRFGAPPLLSDLALLAFACTIGFGIGRGIGSPGAAIAFLVTAATVDTVSFATGVTRALLRGYVEGRSHALEHLSLTVPLLGRAVPVIGVGDLILLAATAGILRRLGHGAVPAILVPTLPFVLALAAGFLLRTGVPALPFLAVAVGAFLITGGRPMRGASPMHAPCR